MNLIDDLTPQTHVMASSAGSLNVDLWKNINGRATIVECGLTTARASKLQKDYGIEWVRYGAQKYFEK